MVSFLWASPELLNNTGRVSNQLLHITDFLPTFVALAGGILIDSKIHDGFNQWPTIQNQEKNPSPRSEVVLNILNEFGRYSIISGRHKIVKGNYFKGSAEANKW